MNLLLLLSLITLSSFTTSTDPTAPSWPSRFSQTFIENFTYPIVGTGTTTGTFYYDWSNKRYRVDRENGKWDRYCGTIYKFQSTPCSHIVVDGMRYLYFPEKNYCCMCCTDKGGCGVLKPNWMDGSIYEGEIVEEGTGVKFDVFNNKGLQDNRVYYEQTTGRMARIVQGSNDDQKFSVSSFNDGFDDQVLELPQGCDPTKKCSMFSICGALDTVKVNSV